MLPDSEILCLYTRAGFENADPSGTNDAERLAKLIADPVNNLREIAELLGQIEPEARRDPDKGRTANEMGDWYGRRGIDSRSGQGDYRDGVWYVRYCFLSRDDAEAFVSRFGGQLLVPERSSKHLQVNKGRK
jgi:hypothetical protein